MYVDKFIHIFELSLKLKNILKTMNGKKLVYKKKKKTKSVVKMLYGTIFEDKPTSI